MNSSRKVCMTSDAFDLLEQAIHSGGPGAGFDFLIRELRAERKYSELFEALLMKKRRELGLPLIQTELLGNLSDETRRAYENGYVQAAREVGGLLLADGEIVRAWPYFRAIGET